MPHITLFSIGYTLFFSVFFSLSLIRTTKVKKPLINFVVVLIWAVSLASACELPFNYYLFCVKRTFHPVIWLFALLMALAAFVIPASSIRQGITLAGVFHIAGRSKKSFILASVLTVLPIVLIIFFALKTCTFRIPSAMTLVSFCIWGPVCEEYVFRYCLPRLPKIKLNIWFEFFLFSVLFASLHIFDNFNLVVFITSLVFSMYSYLLLKTNGTLFFPIVFHICKNLIAVLFSA
jgi:CAAX amino terminal protease family.